MAELYRDYFDIDPEYYPQVNEARIKSDPELWKKYYPHESFVRLLGDTIRVISKKENVSLWVQGAYGTGKSHTVFTLKKLIEASEEETKEYFEEYKSQLSIDLYNKLQQAKSGGKILTVHRYGSSYIRNDSDLVFAMQESILNAMQEAGIDDSGQIALKDSIISWLSNKAEKDYFNSLLSSEYEEKFNGDNVDDIIHKLETYSGQSLQSLIGRIMQVGEERHFTALTLSVDEFVKWVKEVIRINNIKAIIFIWDEFSEFFINNMRSLTGFQQIAEISATDPFYLMIVTHQAENIFPQGDSDYNKLRARFMEPACRIELPDKTAFRLMAHSMKKKKDDDIIAEWNEIKDDLYGRTRDSRDLVRKQANLSDGELQGILPIHPYAALILKNISAVFDSNQRSMFDFIKNDRGDEIKGFQWFIDNYGPFDDNPLLTVDMLWDFFYEKGKDNLDREVKAILDNYERQSKLSSEESRVYKTILIMQAVSQKAAGVETFLPDEKTINYAFEGSDLDSGRAGSVAERLVDNQVIYKKPTGIGKYQYTALSVTVDTDEIEKYKVEFSKKSTSTIISEGDFASTIKFDGALGLRYDVYYAADDNFRNTVNKIRNQYDNSDNKIPAVITFAKNDIEGISISKKINDIVADSSFDIVFIETTAALGNNLFDQYKDALANARYQQGKDNAQAKAFDKNSKDILKKWLKNIENSEMIVRTHDHPEMQRANTKAELEVILKGFVKERYPLALELDAHVVGTMWVANSLKKGAECGAEQKTSGTFRSSNPQTKLENYIGEAWELDMYWEIKPYLKISKIKIAIEEIMHDAFEKEGRISIAKIYDTLKAAPYGFMPCNLTAFVMGFLLKEYADEMYSCSDGITTDNMSVDKLKDMIDEVIKLQQNPISRYKDKYIVTMTEEERSFLGATAHVFGISRSLCSSIEQTRERIRQKMKEFTFPIWTLGYVIDGSKLDETIAKRLLELYCGLANNANFSSSRTDNDIALEIGKIWSAHPFMLDDVKALMTKDNCEKGMDIYLHEYNGGELITLAKEINDSNRYLSCLKNKFDADAANWVWNKDTVNQKIDEVILEYKIIAESNKVISNSSSWRGMIDEWMSKCNIIYLSYDSVKPYLHDEELSSFLAMLVSIKRNRVLQDSKKQEFLNLLVQCKDRFKDFCNKQVQLRYFRQIFNIYEGQLSDEEWENFFGTLTKGYLTAERGEYIKAVDDKFNEFLKNLKSRQLKELWRSRTNTDSPKAWSEKYKMPILCMIKDSEYIKAKEVFDVVNKKTAANSEIESAIRYLQNADFYERLKSDDERNRAFKEKILDKYSIILTDVEDVQNFLLSSVSVEPYDWMNNPVVTRKIESKAKHEYDISGSDKAIQKIDSMDLSDVKRYLKRLIKDNMTVGIEIIREN